ncbi:MAG: hypothetical protein JST89_26710, partial [Cyanobacteria bacterium SZAS-4]|nr:hypothetical protein [Cyanobacteria bacterium SZAS-4]
MRARLVSVILGGLLYLSGLPALADNESAASKGEAKPSGDKEAKVVTDPIPKKEEPKRTMPGGASSPSHPAPIVTDPVPKKEGSVDAKTGSDTSREPAAGTSSSAGGASPTTPKEGSASTSPGSTPEAPTAGAAPGGDVQSMEPHKRPVPEGYAAAAELFKQRKFPQAEKEFEKIVQSGTADVNTHLCLAHCFLQQKIYTKAVKEFDWLAKYAKNSMTLQKSCEATARSLRNAMSGFCPASCLKINDPRWTMQAGHKVLLLPRAGGGVDTITPDSLGHLV